MRLAAELNTTEYFHLCNLRQDACKEPFRAHSTPTSSWSETCTLAQQPHTQMLRCSWVKRGSLLLVQFLFFCEILDNTNEQHPEVFKPEWVYTLDQFIPFPLGEFTNLIKYIWNASGSIDFHWCRSYLLGRLQPCWSGYLDCFTHSSAFKQHRRCSYFLVLFGSCASNGTDGCHRSAYIWLKSKDVPFFPPSLRCRSLALLHWLDKVRSHSGLVLRSIWKTGGDGFIPCRRVGNQTDEHTRNTWMSRWITSHTSGIRSALKNYRRPFCLQGHTLSRKWVGEGGGEVMRERQQPLKDVFSLKPELQKWGTDH